MLFPNGIATGLNPPGTPRLCTSGAREVHGPCHRSGTSIMSVDAPPAPVAEEHRFPCDDKLVEETGAPAKVVWAAMMREFV